MLIPDVLLSTFATERENGQLEGALGCANNASKVNDCGADDEY